MIFFGYACGRVGHLLIGHLNTPHHWILGIAMIILGTVLYPWFAGKMTMFSGIGVLISDFKDFTQLKLIGCDGVREKRFWGFD
jgi:hypothetical protein